MHEQPLTCAMAALTPAERERRQELSDRLARATEETREEPDGYALRLPPDLLAEAAAFIDLERRCCPFFRFALEVEPDGGPLLLRIGGRADVKAFIAAEMGWSLR